jgi:hypothetical protein
MRDYISLMPKGAPMMLTFILSRLAPSGRRRFVWSPALDLTDHSVFSTLIAGAQY